MAVVLKEFVRLFYAANRSFFLAWLLFFAKSFAWTLAVNKPTRRLTSNANAFVDARSKARQKPMLTGYITPDRLRKDLG